MKTFLKNFSKVLKKLRQDKDYSQEAIAFQIGLSPSGYGKIERGEADLSISRIDQIAKVFGLTASQVISMVDKISLPSSTMESQVNSLKNELSALSSSYLRLQGELNKLKERVEILEKNC